MNLMSEHDTVSPEPAQTSNPVTIREAFTSPGGKTYMVVNGELTPADDDEQGDAA